jgi:hypothetical protein
MKIKLLTSVAIAGNVCKPGAEVEVDKFVGKDLIHRNRAVSLEAPTEATTITSEAFNTEAPKGRKKKSDGDETGE